MLDFVQMSAITLNVPEALAARIRSRGDRASEILELGLREWNAETLNGFQGAVEVLEFLAGLPSPEETLRLRPSEQLQNKVQELLEKNRTGALDPLEEEAWERYQFLEHLVRLAKAKACLKLGVPPVSDE